ncbi:hypothetical protein [Streptomyces sp. NRRL B-24484]|uniref:hypothetical protein n=1 Tax=Streptomyces sp. NRRL B-24484 TaxID=1463833 RepID=UPI000A999347|nr:hypothetical protein [Streptomyces sp. NRRL B-24484]
MNHAIDRMTGWNPDLTLATTWIRARIDAARTEEDGGFSTVEMVIGIAILIAILVAVAVILSGALTTKATTVGNCITGANSTNNGGCS